MNQRPEPARQSSAPKIISLGRQLVICIVMCVIAAIIMALWFPRPVLGVLLAGLPLPWQVGAGLAIGAGLAVGTWFGARRAKQGASTRRMAENYGRLDLRGFNPLWIALLAGFGEELLFRGALQPLVGLWITSVLFVLVHARAYRFRRLDKALIGQVIGLFMMSVVLGLMARFGGLLTAMIAHATIDVAGLYVIRREVLAAQLATLVEPDVSD